MFRKVCGCPQAGGAGHFHECEIPGEGSRLCAQYGAHFREERQQQSLLLLGVKFSIKGKGC